jgi:VIT1/CCC1 family predicted Fe2+/Mn2+ transporter
LAQSSLFYASNRLIVPLVVVTSLIFLASLGALAAYAGRAKILPGAARVTFWGALAMAITAGVGAIFGKAP